MDIFWLVMDRQHKPQEFQDDVRKKLFAAFYMFWWAKKYPIAKRLHPLSKGTLVLAAGFLIMETIHLIFGVEIFAGWLKGNARWILLTAAVLVFFHHFRDWLIKREEFHFVKGMEPLLDALNNLATTEADLKDQTFEDFVQTLLEIVHDTFKEKRYLLRKQRSTKVNVMLPDADQKLKVTYLFPVGTLYDPQLALGPREGVAGVCFAERNIVYIPAVKYGDGIALQLADYATNDIEPQKLGTRPNVYKALSEKRFEIFSSFLSVPIVDVFGEAVGVLNIDSEKRDAFDFYDAYVANSYARLLGIATSLRETESFENRLIRV